MDLRDRIWARIVDEMAIPTRPHPLDEQAVLGADPIESFDEALARLIGHYLSFGTSRRELSNHLRPFAAGDASSGSAEDLIALVERDQASHSLLQAFLYRKGFQALAAYRIASAAMASGEESFAHAVSHRCNCVYGVDIHPAAKIAGGVVLDHGTGIVVGETAEVESGCYLFHGVTLGSTGAASGKRHPTLRTGVFVGAGATILGDVEIGAGSVIAAGSVVVRSVPAGRLAGGVPAKDLGEAPVLLPPK